MSSAFLNQNNCDEEEEALKAAIELSLQHRITTEIIPDNRYNPFAIHVDHEEDQAFDMAIAMSIKDAQEDDKDREHYDSAIARSIVEADQKAATDEELDYAFALSLDDADKAENGYWLCNFCSYFSPPTYKKCIMCDSSPWAPAVQMPAPVIQHINKRCGLPGCPRPPVYFDFCSPDHRQRAEQRSIMPPAEIGVHTVFIGPSGELNLTTITLSTAINKYLFVMFTGEFTVHLLTKAHPDHAVVKTQFLNGWLHPTYDTPHVMRIYKIRNSPQVFHSFEELSVLGNIQTRFHGTKQHINCNFGSNPGIPPCDRVECNVCNICRQSFSLQYSGRGGATRMNLRYGQGLYFSATSSKSHDYNQESQKLLRTGML